MASNVIMTVYQNTEQGTHDYLLPSFTNERVVLLLRNWSFASSPLVVRRTRSCAYGLEADTT